MKAQATRIEPTKPANSIGEMLGVMLCGVAVGAGIALFHAITWAPFK